MSDQIHPAPQAPQPTATPVPLPTAATRPTTANAAPLSTTPGAAVPSETTPPAPTTEEVQTLNSRLNSVDRYWKFKGVLQAATIVVGFIGIGTIGWCLSTIPSNGYTFGYDYGYILWPCLLSFAISIVWCAACILVLVMRKRPVQPGVRVAIELILWLVFIATALTAMLALTELINWGEFGDLSNGYYSSSGRYRLADNGTWVWRGRSSSDSDTYSSSDYTRDCNRTSSSSSSYNRYPSTFRNCQEQDAYVNKFWQEKPHRQGVEMVGAVCQFLALVLHFALFIWACVDCHHHNRKKVSKDAEKLAASIVQTMISNGAVIPPPGQAHMRPGMPWGQQQMGYYQLPVQQQGYYMTSMYPQRMMPAQPAQQQHPASQGISGPASGPVASSSNEKSEGPRYA